jgi:hypothetical protein
MKLRAEFPARQMPANPRPSPGAADRGVRTQTGTPRQAPAELFRDLALSLNLSGDALDASLLSLAKFFSLPLDTKLLLRLRQQALSLAPAPREEGRDQPAPLRAAAFAAAAAAGKGVVLSPEALGSYAAALAPDDRDREAPTDPADGEGRDGAETPGDEAGGAPGFSAPQGEDGGLFAERIEGRLPLLGILNRIPGRDGRRWISLPFSFRSEGVDFRVSLRLVLADTNGIPWKAERMALDVTTGRRRWSFMLENAGAGAGKAFARAVFGAQPPLTARAERSLRKLLGSLADKLVLRDSSTGAFPEEEAGQWDR